MLYSARAVPDGPKGRKRRPPVKTDGPDITVWLSILLTAVMAVMAVLSYLKG
ncbi:MAG TPA: hypothetical protein VF594_06950 [Rubricoccaceae bacterium]|jgi:hypothetical protein